MIMRYRQIPYSAKWDDLLDKIYNIPYFNQRILLNDSEVMEILDEVLNLINQPEKWIELSDEEGYNRDGIYVVSRIYDSDPDLYTIIYDGEIILTFDYNK